MPLSESSIYRVYPAYENYFRLTWAQESNGGYALILSTSLGNDIFIHEDRVTP